MSSQLPKNKRVVIIGGGTNTYISNHLALSAPAYGTTARHLYRKFLNHSDNKMDVELCLTKMADPSQGYLDTPEDVETLVDKLVADPDTRVIIFNVAMVDYKPTYLQEWRTEDKTRGEDVNTFGKYERRISTTGTPVIDLELKPYDKIINKIRKERKDILLVGFKTTCGATKEEQFHKGLKLCKDASANIVFVNDVDKKRIENLNYFLECKKDPEKYLESQKDNIIFHHGLPLTEEKTRKIKLRGLDSIISELQNNGLVTPEESSYWYNTRDEALDGLVQMVLDRSHLHFTRSTVVDSETVPWSFGYTSKSIPVESKNFHITSLPVLIPIPNPIIPESFRAIFNWVRFKGAYKQGPTGATVGHFGIALGPNEFLTSKRKTDFNKIEEVGLVRVITDDPDNVFGYKHFFMSESEKEYEYWKDCLKNPNSEILSMPPLQTGIREDKVIAFGAKPSVGGQSQRSLFNAFPDLDCIVHFHCPLKSESRELFKPVQQFSFECGSFGCIENNLSSFHEFKVSEAHSIWAGHMDYHGPNIVFNSNIDPQLVIEFIETHWALDKRTTGLSDELK